MKTLRHVYPLTILESHLDSFGHVNHSVYLPLFEEARWDWVTKAGYGLDRVRETGIGPIILDVHMRFMKELRLHQKITIETHLLSCGKKLAVVGHEVKNESGEICCRTELKFGLFDIQNRKLIPATPEWLKAIGAEEST